MDPHLSAYDPTRQQGMGLRRFLGVYITARNAKWGVGVVAALLFAQYTFKDELKPSIVGGNIIGDFWKGEQDAARPATVATTDQVANVQAQAQARAQQQIIAQQQAQQYGAMITMPQVLGSWVAQGACAFAVITNNVQWQPGCIIAAELNRSIGQQAGAVVDQLGPTRAWDGAPKAGAATVPVAIDAAPLVQAEFDRMYRLQKTLSAGAVADCRKEAPGATNTDSRKFLACLRVSANEDLPAVAVSGPRVIDHTRDPLPVRIH